MSAEQDPCENRSDMDERTKRIKEILRGEFPEQVFIVTPILTTSKHFPFSIEDPLYQYPWMETIMADGGFIKVFWMDGISQKRVAKALSKERPLIDFHRDVSPQNWNRVAEEVWVRFPEGTFQSNEDLTFQIFVDHEIWKTDFPHT
ncbi:hypothetical protein ISS96_01620 [Candidatus Bathyarchaeota archaeon]|nr:hypothetical protein [Candidatus Bathyarchaeota archaeon]